MIPNLTTIFISLTSIPLSMIIAIKSGITTSKITSTTTSTGVKIVSFLYSFIWAKSVFNIYIPP